MRRLRALGREDGVDVHHDPGHGKGSHARVYYGAAFTTVKDARKEIGAGLLAAMLRDLGITRDRWDRR